jgi:hypothetical protein
MLRSKLLAVKLLAVSALFALPLVTFATDDPVLESYRTEGRFNCRWWLTTSSFDYRIGVAMGHSDSWSLFYGPGPIHTALSANTYGEIVKGVTSVCEKPENANLPVYAAEAIFGGRLTGLPEYDEEKVAAGYRAIYNAQQKPATHNDQVHAQEK